MPEDTDSLELIQPDPPAGSSMLFGEPFSPDAFKENVAPRLPVSGGKARSPGLSPLGRKKMRARTEQSRDLPQQPGGVQSKTPKRSLNFGGSSLETAEGKRSKSPVSQSLFQDPAVSTQVVQKQVGITSSSAVEQTPSLSALSIKDQSPRPALIDIHRNEEMLDYDFSEDGDPVAAEFFKVDPNISNETEAGSPSGRVVLGEMERMKMPSPSLSQKGKKILEDSPSKRVLRSPRPQFGSQSGSPVTSPMRV